MDNQLQIFENSEFGELGILLIDGKEHFPATECARMLGYSNPQEAIRNHCKGVREILTPTNGGEQKVRYIPEGDLYRLIVKSQLSSAERFECWVFDEVIPQIRKTGSYSVQPMTQAEMLLYTAEALVDQERQIKALAENQDRHEQFITAVKDVMAPSDKKWRQWVGEELNRVVRVTGQKHDEVRHEAYEMLEKRAACNLVIRLKNHKERLYDAGASKTKISSANRLDVIEADPRLKEIYTSIIRELVIKHVA